MIPVPSGVRVWLAGGVSDMRRGMNGLTLQVQEGLGRDPHAGDLFVFRGRRGDLIKILWHDGLGLSLYAKRLDHGRFIWPAPADGAVAISAAQLGLFARRDRLAQPTANLAADCGRVTECDGPILLQPAGHSAVKSAAWKPFRRSSPRCRPPLRRPRRCVECPDGGRSRQGRIGTADGDHVEHRGVDRPLKLEIAEAAARAVRPEVRAQGPAARAAGAAARGARGHRHRG